MLDFANTRVAGAWVKARRLGFAKPSTRVLNLAKPRAESTWTGRNKGGKSGGCRNKGRRAWFWKIDSAKLQLDGWGCSRRPRLLRWHGIGGFCHLVIVVVLHVVGGSVMDG